MAQLPNQRLGTRLDMCVHDREKWVESSKEGEREKEMRLRRPEGAAQQVTGGGESRHWISECVSSCDC